MIEQRDTSLNMLKLASELVLMIVFMSTALLRSIDTKVELVDTCLTADDLTAEDRNMPDVLSVFMVLFSISLPFGTLVYTKIYDVNAAADSEEDGDELEIDAGHSNMDVELPSRCADCGGFQDYMNT